MAEKSVYVTHIEPCEAVNIVEYRRRWKQVIAETLKELGFIDEKYRGKVVIDVNDGGVRSLDTNKHYE